MTLEVGWTPLETVFAEPNFRALIEQQWQELSDLDEPPEPDFARALFMEKNGTLKVWAAYREGRLYGFIQWWLIHPLSHRGRVWAVDGGHYIDRENRDIFLALRMWRGAEAALREMGVTMLRAHDNGNHPLDAFFKRLGFDPVSTMYQKVL